MTFLLSRNSSTNPKISDWLSGKEIFKLYLEVFIYITKSRDAKVFTMNPRRHELYAYGSLSNKDLKAAFTCYLGHIMEIVKLPDPTCSERASHSGHWVYWSPAKAEFGLRT